MSVFRSLAVLACSVAMGCGGSDQHPRAGDRILPRLHLQRPWTAGESGVLFMELQVSGGDPINPRVLRTEEVPEATTLRCQITFHKEDEPLGPPRDIPLERRPDDGGEFEVRTEKLDIPAAATFARVQVNGHIPIEGVELVSVSKRVMIQPAQPLP